MKEYLDTIYLKFAFLKQVISKSKVKLPKFVAQTNLQ